MKNHLQTLVSSAAETTLETSLDLSISSSGRVTRRATTTNSCSSPRFEPETPAVSAKTKNKRRKDDSVVAVVAEPSDPQDFQQFSSNHKQLYSKMNSAYKTLRDLKVTDSQWWLLSFCHRRKVTTYLFVMIFCFAPPQPPTQTTMRWLHIQLICPPYSNDWKVTKCVLWLLWLSGVSTWVILVYKSRPIPWWF